MQVGDVDLYAFEAPAGLDGGALRELALATRAKAGHERSTVVVVLSVTGDKVAAVAAVNDTGQQAGLTARDVLAAAMPSIEGRGGGKADVAQGGGSNPAGVATALAAVRSSLEG